MNLGTVPQLAFDTKDVSQFISDLTAIGKGTTTIKSDDRTVEQLSRECLQALSAEGPHNCQKLANLVKALENDTFKKLKVVKEAQKALKVAYDALVTEYEKFRGASTGEEGSQISNHLTSKAFRELPLAEKAISLTKVIRTIGALIWPNRYALKALLREDEILITLSPLLSQFSKLKSLIAEKNDLSEVGEVIGNVPNLEYVSFANNYITKVSPAIGLLKLFHLNLRGNKLKSFPIEALENLKTLQFFDMRENPLLKEEINRIAAILKPRGCLFYYTPIAETS